MSDKATHRDWLEGLIAEFEKKTSDFKRRAAEETARLLSTCSEGEASALRLALEEENAELARQLPLHRPSAVIGAIIHRQEIVLAALQAFEKHKSGS
jgi:hypothetical protein